MQKKIENDNMLNRNFLRLGGLLFRKYAYIDLNVDEDYPADSLFYKREIPVYFKNEMVRDGDKYRVIFCKVHKKYVNKFEEALEELKNKMVLLGHNDYEEYCRMFMLMMKEGIHE